MNAQDNDRSTSLHLVIFEEHFKSAKLLLDHGASVHVRNNDGRTPLHAAVGTMHGQGLNSYFKVIQLLLDHNAVADAQDNDQWTLLQLASRHSNFDAAQLLIEHGANLHLRNKGQTPLHLVLEDRSQFWGNYLDFT